MNKLFTLTTCALVTFSASSQNSSNSSAPYSAGLVTLGHASTKFVFGEGPNGGGLYKSSQDWKYIPYDVKSGLTTADASETDIVVLTTKGELKRWSQAAPNWATLLHISNVKDVAVLANGKGTVALGSVKQADGSMPSGIFMTSGIPSAPTSWKPIGMDATAATFNKVSEGANGDLYLVNNTGDLFVKTQTASTYAPVDLQGKKIKDVEYGGDGNLYVQEHSGAIWKYNLSNKVLSPMNFNANSYGVDNLGNIYGEQNQEYVGVVGGAHKTMTIDNPNQLDANGNTPLTAAALLSDDQKAEEALKTGASMSVLNRNGDNPMTIAAKNNDMDLMRVFLKYDIDVNALDQDGHSALYWAVKKNYKKMSQLLLLGDANPNAGGAVEAAVEDRNKDMILVLSTYNADLSPGLVPAAAAGDKTFFQTLIGAGARCKDTEPFKRAVDGGYKDIAKMCLDNGTLADSAIVYATAKNSGDITRYCLEKGANTEPAVRYVVRNNDVAMASELIQRYRVRPTDLLSASIANEEQSSMGKILNKKPNLQIAEIALQNKANPDEHLDKAIATKDNELLSLLLKYGADANKVLKAAIDNNDPALAAMALQNGAQTTDPTYLKSAIDSSRTEMAVLLINNGATVTDPALMQSAVKTNNLEVTTLMLERGASARDPELIKMAVQRKDQPMMNTLLQYGADATDGMDIAVGAGDYETAQLLISKGGSVLEPKLLATASGSGNMQMVELLVNNGANVDNGMEAAINSGKTNVFTYLVDKGANPSKPEYVAAAVRRNDVGMFKKLMEYNAPVTWVGNNNENLLHISARNGNYEMTEALLKKGVDVNQKSNTGDTPLHFAVEVGRNNIDFAALFVENGADLNATNNRGKSIYRTADGKKLKKYLQKKGARK